MFIFYNQLKLTNTKFYIKFIHKKGKSIDLKFLNRNNINIMSCTTVKRKFLINGLERYYYHVNETIVMQLKTYSTNTLWNVEFWYHVTQWKSENDDTYVFLEKYNERHCHMQTVINYSYFHTMIKKTYTHLYAKYS